MNVKIHFWNKDHSEDEIIKDFEYAPIVGDEILYLNRWYEVTVRGLDIDTGKYTKIHCTQVTEN
jgi:hypothetical protein